MNEFALVDGARVLARLTGDVDVTAYGDSLQPCGPEVTPQTHYYSGEAFVALPAAPCGFCDFDYDALAWAPNVDKAMTALRARRDRLLAASDWYTLRAIDRGAACDAAYLAYRQALRDLPATCADPFNPQWPGAPACLG